MRGDHAQRGQEVRDRRKAPGSEGKTTWGSQVAKRLKSQAGGNIGRGGTNGQTSNCLQKGGEPS